MLNIEWQYLKEVIVHISLEEKAWTRSQLDTVKDCMLTLW